MTIRIDDIFAALLLSLLFIVLGKYGFGFACCGMMLFQMTMPITLSAVYRMFPGRPGWSFGLCCLALVAGALPVFSPMGAHFGSSIVLAFGTGVTTLLFYYGIKRVSLQRSLSFDRKS